jgi:hypothetical protein
MSRADPAIPMLALGGRLIARALPLDAGTLRREVRQGSLRWRVPGWARALPPLAAALVLGPLSALLLLLGEPGLGPAVLCGVLAAAALGGGWLRGAFHGGMEVRADASGVDLRQGSRGRRVPRSDVRAVQLFGPAYWEFAQHGGWRVRYALGLRLADHVLVVGQCRSATRLDQAAKELATVLRLPLEPAGAPAPKEPRRPARLPTP